MVTPGLNGSSVNCIQPPLTSGKNERKTELFPVLNILFYGGINTIHIYSFGKEEKLPIPCMIYLL